MISKETSAMWVVLAHCGEMYITEQTPCCSVNMSYQLCDSWMPLELPPFTLQTMIKKKKNKTDSFSGRTLPSLCFSTKETSFHPTLVLLGHRIIKSGVINITFKKLSRGILF